MKQYAAMSHKQIATPSNPASGFNKIYPKSDDKFYRLNSSGTEVALASSTDLSSGIQQVIGTPFSFDYNVSNNVNSCSENDGSTIWLAIHPSTSTNTVQLARAERQASGLYAFTHYLSFNTESGTTSSISLAVIGSYLYFCYADGGSPYRKVKRFLKADLTDITSMTISGSRFNNGDGCFTDGTYLYISNGFAAGAWTYYKYSISGTTLTYDSTKSFTLVDTFFGYKAFNDASNVFFWGDVSTSGINKKVICSYAFAGGSQAARQEIYSIDYATMDDVLSNLIFWTATGVYGIANTQLMYLLPSGAPELMQLNIVPAVKTI